MGMVPMTMMVVIVMVMMLVVITLTILAVLAPPVTIIQKYRNKWDRRVEKHRDTDGGGDGDCDDDNVL